MARRLESEKEGVERGPGDVESGGGGRGRARGRRHVDVCQPGGRQRVLGEGRVAKGRRGRRRRGRRRERGRRGGGGRRHGGGVEVGRCDRVMP